MGRGLSRKLQAVRILATLALPVALLVWVWDSPLISRPYTDNGKRPRYLAPPLPSPLATPEFSAPSAPPGPIYTPPNNPNSAVIPVNFDRDSANSFRLLEHGEVGDLFFPSLNLDFSSPQGRLHLWPTQAWGPVRNGAQMRRQALTAHVFLPEAACGYQAEVVLTPGRAEQTVLVKVNGQEIVAFNATGSESLSHVVDLSKATRGGGYFEIAVEVAGPAPYPVLQNLILGRSDRPLKLDPRQNAYNVAAKSIGYLPPEPRYPTGSIADRRIGNEKLPFPSEGGVVWHVQIPDNARLLWNFDLKRNPAGERLPEQERVTLLVRLANADGVSKTVFAQSVGLRGFPFECKNIPPPLFGGPQQCWPGAKQTHSVDLRPYAGKVIRLEFWLQGGHETDVAYVIAPRIERWFAAEPDVNWQPPENVVVWLSDTLRWDKVRAYKPENNPIITPTFDRLATEGVVFTNALSQGNWSKTSQAAIMAGRYPFDTNMIRPEQTRKADVALIADAIEAARPEVTTASFSSNGYVSSAFGFDQNWDISRNMIRESLPNKTEYLIAAMDTAWKKDDLFGRPFFVWMGTIDPHVAYSPRKAFLALYDDKPYHGIVNPYKTHELLLHIRRKTVTMSERDWARLFALYHGEISYNDDQLRVFMDMLENWGKLESTAIIVVADHGEAFMEHGDTGHGGSLYDEQVRVPFIIYYPRGVPRPRVVDDAVQTMAIYPTALQMLGIAPPEKTQAQSLLPYLHGVAPLWPRAAVTTLGSHKAKLMLGHWRMIDSGSERLLFDAKSDPYEKRNQVDKRPDIRYYMTLRLADWKAAYRPD